MSYEWAEAELDITNLDTLSETEFNNVIQKLFMDGYIANPIKTNPIQARALNDWTSSTRRMDGESDVALLTYISAFGYHRIQPMPSLESQ